MSARSVAFSCTSPTGDLGEQLIWGEVSSFPWCLRGGVLSPPPRLCLGMVGSSTGTLGSMSDFSRANSVRTCFLAFIAASASRRFLLGALRLSSSSPAHLRILATSFVSLFLVVLGFSSLG